MFSILLARRIFTSVGWFLVSCHQEYFNRSKPPKCPKCDYFLGGTFNGPRKKVKSASPALVDYTLVCFHAERLDMIAVLLQFAAVCGYALAKSGVTFLVDMASHYECAEAHANCDPVAVYQPRISSYPCSESVRDKLREVAASLPGDTPPVVHVFEQPFAVFSLPTASNPLGFCHVKKEGKTKIGYVCTAKDQSTKQWRCKSALRTYLSFSHEATELKTTARGHSSRKLSYT